MRAVDIILKKKNGEVLSQEEIHYIIDGYIKNEIPDYQISALLMAICFQGLNQEEQVNLTNEILNSGDKNDLDNIEGLCVDKHSTGGVGDKTTLVIAPIIASCGLKIAKMSGRGLGHTGGTLDKLEAIPGFNIAVQIEDFYKQVNDIGLAVVGQTQNITPADKKLYALRDVTGTVESIGLIASSVMSKKLASGAKNILLDVKVGDGAFMKNVEDATKLAEAMVSIGTSCGRKTVALLTDMDQPLGKAVGNSLEVIEAIETLKGNGPKRFTELCYAICTEMLIDAGVVSNEEDAIKLINEQISSKKALAKLYEMITYQKGNGNVIDDYFLLPIAKEKVEVRSLKEGYVSKIKTYDIGVAAMNLGAGRLTKDDSIDYGVGVVIEKEVGDKVQANEVIATIYTNGKNTDLAVEMVQNAYTIVDSKPSKKPIVIAVIR